MKLALQIKLEKKKIRILPSFIPVRQHAWFLRTAEHDNSCYSVVPEVSQASVVDALPQEQSWAPLSPRGARALLSLTLQTHPANPGPSGGSVSPHLAARAVRAAVSHGDPCTAFSVVRTRAKTLTKVDPVGFEMSNTLCKCSVWYPPVALCGFGVFILFYSLSAVVPQHLCLTLPNTRLLQCLGCAEGPKTGWLFWSWAVTRLSVLLQWEVWVRQTMGQHWQHGIGGKAQLCGLGDVQVQWQSCRAVLA